MKRALLAAALTLASTAAEASVLRLSLNQMIHPISDEFIGRGLAQAERQRDAAVIIEMSTPGGLLDSTRDIVEKIMTSRVPVIVYVAPTGSRAASAGFFILESADIAAMAPGTNTGAAHPVILGEKMDEIMKMKMENDAAASFSIFIFMISSIFSPRITGCAAPVFVPGAIAAMSADSRMKNPADAARLPVGAT